MGRPGVLWVCWAVLTWSAGCGPSSPAHDGGDLADGSIDADTESDADAGGGEPAPHASAEPEPWQPPGSTDSAAFPLGVQTGDATARGVIVQARTDEPAVSIVVVEGADDEWVEVHREELSTEGGFARVTLDGLQPDHAYPVRIQIGFIAPVNVIVDQ